MKAKVVYLTMALVLVFSLAAVAIAPLGPTMAAAPALQDGGSRLVELQNDDGGWDWPLDDGNPATGSALNTIGPIGKGLAEACKATGDADMLTALGKVATFLQSKTNYHSPPDGYLAAELDSVLGGTTNVEFVNTNWYDKLAKGTYDHEGADTNYDTAGYIDWLQTRRQGTNWAAWDIGMGLVGAASAVVADSELDYWIQGVKDEINEMDGALTGDVLGLAGGLYGLAFVGEEFGPTAGDHAAASNLKDLADILASYQVAESGGFAWNSLHVAPGEEWVQETAYAILALSKVGGYDNETYRAARYLESVQLGTGGWENSGTYPDETGENNEMTAEALWGIAVAPAAPTGGDGCFIATAAYGTSTAAEIDNLRAFRDEVLLQTSLGSQLVAFYYEVSPPVADFISEHEGLRTLVRELLVDPVAWLVEATGTLWRD